MQRREMIRQFFGRHAPVPELKRTALAESNSTEALTGPHCYSSQWHKMPGAAYASLGILPQPSNAWRLQNGALQCLACGAVCTAQVLSHQLSNAAKGFTANLSVRFLQSMFAVESNIISAGMYFGPDAVVAKNTGITAGIRSNGYLFIGEKIGSRTLPEQVLAQNMRLSFSVMPQAAGGLFAKLKVLDMAGNTCATLAATIPGATAFSGAVALYCSTEKQSTPAPAVAFSRFTIEGEKLVACTPAQTGP